MKTTVSFMIPSGETNPINLHREMIWKRVTQWGGSNWGTCRRKEGRLSGVSPSSLSIPALRDLSYLPSLFAPLDTNRGYGSISLEVNGRLSGPLRPASPPTSK